MDHDLIESIFRFICQFVDEHGYPPSQREIAKACYLSRTGVVIYLNKLAADGRITRVPRAARGIRIQRAPAAHR
jgi:repressor LexA